MPKQVKVGYAPGVFDFAHPGHLNFFIRCRELCETFIIGVNTDEFTASYKEPPPYPLAQRVAALEGLGLADEVVVIDWDVHGTICAEYVTTHTLHGYERD